ncbi:cytochrome c peroxidase [Desulfuromonas soudanensis]|uniref:Methylamine utilization protein MauG n=1 Tax=Desulfuromonas soudanensis TaxID=1603606 RepID=A0A0M3QF24_9BACT|nr:cytochrome c peroxidase [Desulfuromonas soudanensis]ALC15333.1 cytochrome c peroxidase [Desulfuromonas soudanensis]
MTLPPLKGLGYSRRLCQLGLLVLLLFGTRTWAQLGIVLPAPLAPIELQSTAKIELGHRLFFDRRLSGDGTMSCAVCHLPDQAFADGRDISGAYPTTKHWRNTPTLLNAAYLKTFFWDGRSDSLAHQAAEPIETPFEMNSNLPYIVAKLAEIPEYREAFEKAYSAEISKELILSALAAFEQTLTSLDSPFERYLKGEPQLLSRQARQGMEIFFGPRGGCSQCHAGAMLSDEQFHNLGVAERSDLQEDWQQRATRRFVLAEKGLPMLPRDPGRYGVSKEPSDMGSFRTPPLHQVAQTAPYMHNGSMNTLKDVVAFFSRGGGHDAQKSRQLKSPDFSPEEQAALVAFLESLSGTVPEVHRPHLPGD